MPDQRGDQRREQILGERRDHAPERRANNHADREVNHVAAQQELLKSTLAIKYLSA